MTNHTYIGKFYMDTDFDKLLEEILDSPTLHQVETNGTIVDVRYHTCTDGSICYSTTYEYDGKSYVISYLNGECIRFCLANSLIL